MMKEKGYDRLCKEKKRRFDRPLGRASAIEPIVSFFSEAIDNMFSFIGSGLKVFLFHFLFGIAWPLGWSSITIPINKKMKMKENFQ